MLETVAQNVVESPEAVVALYAVTGSILVLTVYKTMENSIRLSAVTGTAFTAVAVYISRWTGINHLEFYSWTHVEATLIAAAVGTGLGIAFTVLTVEPELSHEKQSMEKL